MAHAKVASNYKVQPKNNNSSELIKANFPVYRSLKNIRLANLNKFLSFVLASTMFFSLPETTLGIILSIFAGFFLYIGASDLLPESHHAHPKKLTTVMTILGIGVLFLAIKIANI